MTARLGYRLSLVALVVSVAMLAVSELLQPEDASSGRDGKAEPGGLLNIVDLPDPEEVWDDGRLPGKLEIVRTEPGPGAAVFRFLPDGGFERRMPPVPVARLHLVGLAPASWTAEQRGALVQSLEELLSAWGFSVNQIKLGEGLAAELGPLMTRLRITPGRTSPADPADR
ncbi:MAG: hypothetical protein ACE5F1_09335 [Planctomycetota bacterium]